MSHFSIWIALINVYFGGPEAIKVSADNLLTRKIEGFGDMAEIVRVVRLEARPESVVNDVRRVVVTSDGRFIVAESRAKQVISFLPNGNFEKILLAQGGGPNEFAGGVIGLEKLESGDLLVLTTQELLTISLNGEVLKKIVLRGNSDYSISGQGLAVSQSAIFVQAALLFDDGTYEIYQFDSSLKFLKSFHPFDVRQNKYSYNGWNHMNSLDNKIFISSHYSPGLYIFEIDGSVRLKKHLMFPDEFKSKLDALWADKNFDEDNRTQIRKYTSHVIGIYPFGEGILFFDSLNAEKRYRMFYLDKDMQLTQIHGYHLFYRVFNKEKAYTLRTIAGYHDGLTIGVLEYDDGFDEFKKQFPLLADLELTDLDNPLLVFFKPKKGW